MKRVINKMTTVALALMALMASCTDKEGPEPTLSVTPQVTDIEFAADGVTLTTGGSTTFTVVTNQSSWKVFPDKTWVKISKSDNQFTVSADPVTGFVGPEAAEITVIAGKGMATSIRIGVQQRGEIQSLQVTPSNIRAIEFSGDGATATSGGTTVQPVFTVSTNVGSWKAESDQAWLTVIEQDNTFTLTAAYNYSLEPPATATVTVSAGDAVPVVITVTQAGGALPSLEVEPSDIRAIEFSGDGETATSDGNIVQPVFTVTTNWSTWEAVSDQMWLTVIKQENTFTLTAAYNSSLEPPATATVTVSAGDATPVVITVTQAGGEPLDIERELWTIVDFSSQWNDNVYGAKNILDDDLGTQWHTDPFDAAVNGMPQWVIVDMYKEQKISGFIFANRNEELSRSPKRIKFEVSSDGETWSEALVVNDIPQIMSEIMEFPCTPVTARYLKVNVEDVWEPDGAWTYISIISIF